MPVKKSARQSTIKPSRSGADNNESLTSSPLTSVRKEIDQLDLTIWALLQKRFVLVGKMGKIKRQLDVPVLDANREKDVLERIQTINADPDVSAAIGKLYKLLFELSKKYQLSQSKTARR